MHKEISFVKNKVAIVTGGSSGIGRAIVEELLRKGYAVSAIARNQSRLQQLVKDLHSFQKHILPIVADVSSENDCKSIIEQTVAHFGTIHVLVNNAGISMRAVFRDVDLSVLKQLMDINFWGTVYCTKYALPYILSNRGSIVGISSIAGLVGLPGRTGYSASKYAMHGFLETLRVEHRKDGLHVMIVCPGFVATNIRYTALDKDGNPQGESPRDEEKMAQPYDVAKIVLKGIEKRKRLIVMTPQGKLIPWMKLIAPSWLDKQLFNEMAREYNSPIK